jgi:hypothetical protein
VAVVGLAAGSAFVAAAAVRWFWPRHDADARTDVALDLRPGAASVVWAGVF